MFKILQSKRILSCLTLVALMAVNYYAQTSGGGQNGAYTNAPSESNCTSCHSGTSLQTSGNNWNTMLLDNGFNDGQYLPDTTYTMTLSYKENGKSKIGFAITALDSATSKSVGVFTITNSSTTQKSTYNVSGNTRTSVYHKSAGTSASGGAISWTFSWKAPSSNVGTIFFYAVINSTNSDNSDNGDVIYAKKFRFRPSDSLPSAIISASPNPVCEGDTLHCKGTGNGNPSSWKWSFANGGNNVSPSSSTNQDEDFVFKIGGSYKIYLQTTNNKGKSPLDSAVIQVNPKPNISISSSSNTNTICQGDSVVLTANYGSGVSILWNTGDTTDKITVTQAGDYFCTATNTSTTCSKTTGKVTVNVVAKPNITLNLNTNNSLCSQDTFKLSVSPSGLTNYYYIVNGSSTNNGSTHTYEIPYSGTSNYQVVALADSAGCMSDTSNSQSLTFNTKLSAPTVSCDTNNSTSITYKWSSVTNATGYQVSEDSGKTWITPSTGSNGLKHTVNGLANNIYLKLFVRATDNAPCNFGEEGAAVCHTGSCTPIAYSTNNYKTSICAGDSSEIDITFTNSGKYAVSVNGATATSQTKYVFKPTQNTSYTFDMTDSTQSSCPATSFKVDIVILPPLNNISIQGNNANNTWCPGETAKFTTAAVSGYTYEFFVNGSSVQKSSSNDYTTTALQNGDKVKVKAINAGGCEGTSSEITVTIQSGLTNISIQSNNANNTWCKGENAKFTSPAVTGYTYEFFVNGSSVQKGSQNEYNTGSLQNGDKVKVVATNAAGCSGSSSEITTTITPGPVATAFKITTSPSGITFNFNDTSSNNATYTHSWNFGDGKTGSGNVVNHTYTQNGTYTVWMVIKNGNCIDSISAQVTAKNTGIEEASIQSQVAVWPNPFTQVINVSWSNESKPVSLELNDVQGARIVTLAKADIYNLSSTTLATENLPSGIYWVKVVMENGQVVKRIIKL